MDRLRLVTMLDEMSLALGLARRLRGSGAPCTCGGPSGSQHPQQHIISASGSRASDAASDLVRLLPLGGA